MLKFVLLIGIFFIALVNINAQNPVCRTISNQTGFPSNTVYNILQDSKGFIWFGHDKGLTKYDGNSFTNYFGMAQQGKSVSNLLEVNGSIWCQDFSGNFYSTREETLIKEGNFKTGGIYSPAGFINGNLLSVVNYDSVRSYNTGAKTTNKFFANSDIKQAVFHNENDSYFFSENDLKKYNGSSIEVVAKFEEKIPDFNFLLKVDTVFYAFSRNNFPLAYKLVNNKIKPLTVLKSALVIQDVCLIENEIWVSTTAGAYCFNKNMEPLHNGFCFFQENSITKIIKDNENSYWFGTLNKGVLLVPDINVKLFRYGSENITALSSYNGTSEVLAGTSSNLIFSFNTKTNKYNTILSNEPKSEILSLNYDSSLKRIINCSNGISFAENGGIIKDYAIAGKVVTRVDDNTYAVAYAGGILLLPRLNKEQYCPWLKPYFIREGNSVFLLQGVRGRSVYFSTATQTLYTATSNGVKYFNASASKDILANNMPIYASALCAIGNDVYAGTFSDGLFRIKNNEATFLNKTNALIAKTIYKMYADNAYLWLVSDELVQRYNTLDNTLINFTIADGLPKAEIKDIISKNGKVIIATTDGLVIFDENKNPINTTPPLLQINKFLVNDKSYNTDSIIDLKPNENSVEVLFSLLSYKDNASTRISYRLNNGEWKDVPSKLRSLQLASLSPGKYVLEIKATNEDGIAATKNIVVKFIVGAKFYQRWWFYALIAAFILATMYIYFRWRLRKAKQANILLAQKIEMEQELHQSLLSSIKSQMNPHFLFNALNTIQSYIYTNEKENASLYLGKFSDLTRTILDMSNKEKVSLADEIRALELYLELEQLRFEDKLHYTLTIAKDVNIETTFIPSMLIQPYVENSVKHGLMHRKEQWKLSINFNTVGSTIQVIIDDNGVGRQASAAINQQRNKGHKSFASSANEKRLNILNKGLEKIISLKVVDKTDEFGYATGTTMILTIPFM